MLLRIEKQDPGIDEKNPLVSAYLNQNLPEFLKLIDEGANINCLDRFGTSLISLVTTTTTTISYHRKYFDALIENDVHLGQIGNECNLLSIAIDQPDIYYLETLLKKDVDINYYKKIIENHENIHLSYPLIFQSIAQSDYTRIKLILDKNPNLKLTNASCETILTHFSIYQNRSAFNDCGLEIYRRLISDGADIHQKDAQGNDAFIAAVKYGLPLDFLNILEENKADFNTINIHGLNPLITAIINRNDTAFSFLIEKEIDFNHQSPDGYSALIYCAASNLKEKINKLIEKGADMSLKTNLGDNIMHTLAKNGYINEYKELTKEYKHLMSEKNNSGMTAFDIVNSTNDKLTQR